MQNSANRLSSASAAAVFSVVLLLVGCENSSEGGSSARAISPTSRSFERTDVSFKVANPQEGNAERVLHGYRIDPACRSDSAVLLLHGLSYTSEAWDFRPEQGYSYARTLAAAGYTVIAIDRLGYGQSVLDNGYLVSPFSHAEMAHEVILKLRKEFTHVAVGGHSAGAHTAELEAAYFGDVDAVIPMAYATALGPEFFQDAIANDVPGTLQSDYVYFLGTPEHRAEMFFSTDADPGMVEADAAAAVLTPSGDVQGSFATHFLRNELITVPVFLQLAVGDRLISVDYAEEEAATFVSAPSVTLDIVAQAGHTYMLHPSGIAAGQRIADWLHTLPSMPACGR